MKARRRPDRSGRSIGDGKYVALYRWEFESPAYRSLCPGARALLSELKNLYNGQNNGDLFLSCRDAAARIHVHKNTALELFETLQARGFIRPKEKGAFSVKLKKATTWILTEFGYAGQTPTKEFMHWRPSHDYPVEPRRPPKNKSRSLQSGQAVRIRATTPPPSPPDCRSKADKTTQIDHALGRSEPDTDKIPGRGSGIAQAESDPDRESEAEIGCSEGLKSSAVKIDVPGMDANLSLAGRHKGESVEAYWLRMMGST